jgi:hypothetical protein
LNTLSMIERLWIDYFSNIMSNHFIFFISLSELIRVILLKIKYTERFNS